MDGTSAVALVLCGTSAVRWRCCGGSCSSSEEEEEQESKELVAMELDLAKCLWGTSVGQTRPGIATPVGAVSHGVLPLVAGSTRAELPLWA